MACQALFALSCLAPVRVLLFWSYYDSYLAAFYRQHDGLEESPSAAQGQALLADYVGWVPHVVRRLEQWGHETRIIVVNARPMQSRWAAEHGTPFDERTWRQAIPLAQVQAFQPDIVIIGSMFNYYGQYLARIRRMVRRVVAWIGVRPPPMVDFSGIDFVLTSHESLQSTFRARGLRCERLLPAFEPSVLAAGPTPPRTIPVSFAGSLSWAHRDRIRLLRSVMRSVPLDLRVSVPTVGVRSAIRPGFVPAFIAARPLLAASLDPVYGLQMYDVLRRSQIGLNVHIHDAAGLAGNMRMFETTGAGAVLVTEDAPNLSLLFEPEAEVVPYRSVSDLVGQVRALLADDARRERIALGGQARTLRDHSTPVRAAELNNLLVGAN